MSEENEDVEVVVEPSEPEVTSEQSEQEEVSKEPAYGSQEYNFRELRRIAEEQQRELRELRAQVQRPVQQEEPDDDEDDFLTKKQVREMLQQQEQASLEDKMRIRFKDYDDVVTDENIKKLIENDDDLADSIRRASNPYATAYKLVRKSAFYSDEQKLKSKKHSDVEKIHKNSQKPASANAATKPLQNANSYANMSKAEMDALYKEMIECARQN